MEMLKLSNWMWRMLALLQDSDLQVGLDKYICKGQATAEEIEAQMKWTPKLECTRPELSY